MALDPFGMELQLLVEQVERRARPLLRVARGSEAEQHLAVQRRQAPGTFVEIDGGKARLQRRARIVMSDGGRARGESGSLLEGGYRRREIVERPVEQAGDVPQKRIAGM